MQSIICNKFPNRTLVKKLSCLQSDQSLSNNIRVTRKVNNNCMILIF